MIYPAQHWNPPAPGSLRGLAPEWARHGHDRLIAAPLEGERTVFQPDATRPCCPYCTTPPAARRRAVRMEPGQQTHLGGVQGLRRIMG